MNNCQDTTTQQTDEIFEEERYYSLHFQPLYRLEFSLNLA